MIEVVYKREPREVEVSDDRSKGKGVIVKVRKGLMLILCLVVALSLLLGISVFGAGAAPPDGSVIDPPPIELLEKGLPTPVIETEYVPGEIIVKFKPGVTDEAITAINSRHVTSVLYTSPYAGFRLISVPPDKTVAEMVELYSKDHNVEYAEPNYIRHAHWTPNDEYYPLQWHLDNDVYGGINMEQAWDIETGDPSVIVAVIDTGVAYEDYMGYYLAPDLAQTSFVPGYDFVNNDSHPNDDNSHGTHVAGTIAQSTNNGIGVAGVAFNCSIMPVKVLDANDDGTDADVAVGIRWATDHGADVINLSLGGPGASITLRNACAYAYNHGVTIVASAGNEYEEGNPVEYPAAYDAYVIAVGATRYDETRSYYSNTGSYLDLTAPGGDMRVDQNDDGYADGVLQQTFNPDTKNAGDFAYWFFQGTSMSAPHVSGVAALLISQGTATTPDDIRQVLQSTAEDHGVAGWDEEYGWGIVDAYAALMWTPPPFALEVGEVSINHTWQTVNLTKPFLHPVVVAKPLSYNGFHAATVRIRNVTPTSFDIVIQEWNYLDRWHMTEQVSYIVMERGHFAVDGAYVEAGTIDTNSTGWPLVSVPFSSEFSHTPVVVSSVMSFNGPDTVVTRNMNVTTTGFEVTMQEQQSNAPWHISETISYIAWEPGTGTVDDPIAYEVGTQPNVNHTWSTISYGPFGDVPIVLMDMQTVNGPDPCNLRYGNKDADSVDVRVDEEQSADSEKWHINETVGYFAFAPPF